jgi:hypothetical protein
MTEKKYSYGECPACGGEKQKLRHLVCRECFESYTNEASDALVKTGKIVYMTSWVAKKIAERVPGLKLELGLLRVKYRSLQTKVKEEVISFIKKSSWRKKVSPEVISEAIRKKSDALWAERGGNKLHHEVMRLMDKINSLSKLLEELRAKGEEKKEEVTV